MINTESNLSKKLVNFLQISAVAFFSVLMLACTPDVPAVSATQAAKMFDDKQAIIIDVREKEEWDEQHIEGAIFMPLDQVESRIGELAQYKDSTVIMQCRSGRRSEIAGAALLEAGFTKVYNLEGGILAWDKENIATVKGPKATVTPK